jgi:hypothetical protein
METMIGFSFIELLIVVALGSPLGVPLSLPPLPEDPVLGQVAPKDCMWYFSSFGCAKPEKRSKNQTEQLLAEDEVQRFIHEIEARLKDALKRGAPGGPEGQALAEDGAKLVKTVLTRPTAAWIESASVGPAGVIVKGGVVVSAGDDAEQVKASLDRVLKVLLARVAPEAQSPPDAKSDGSRIPMPRGAPPVELKWHQQYLIIGIGDGADDEIVKRIGGERPEWLSSIRNELSVPRVSTVHYLNVQGVLGMALPFAGLEGFKVVNTLGISGIKHYASISGLDETAAVHRSTLATSGKPAGLLGLLEGSPLKAADLASVPKDATFAVAAKVDAAKVFRGFLNMIGQIEPRGRQELERDLAQVEKEAGFKIIDDLLASLGDTWVIYNSPSEGGFLVTGATAVVSIRDREKLQRIHQSVIDRVKATNRELARQDEGRGRRQGVEIAEFESNGQKVYFLNFIGDEVPFAPAWCITEKEVVISLFPQMIKARLARGGKGEALAELPDIARHFKSDRGPSALVYQDTKAFFRTLYPFAHMLANIAAGALQQERVNVDISLLPSAAAIEPHLLPGVTAVYVTDKGIRAESHSSVPVGGAGLVGAAVPMMFFARASVVHEHAVAATPVTIALSPEAVHGNQTNSNLRQLGLAMHNHMEAFKHLPVADGSDKDKQPRLANKPGRPLLSWRVHVLPFLEEQALFSQFKLDEPWDSEHNKKLIEKMPALYRTPGSAAAKEHKTGYLSVRGKDTIHPAGEKIRPKDITDGFSQTAMIVEVDDERAVIWTKPDDFEPASDDPLKGLLIRNGKFHLLFGDGSVHTLPDSINKETLRALYTRAGGETVNLNN